MTQLSGNSATNYVNFFKLTNQQHLSDENTSSKKSPIKATSIGIVGGIAMLILVPNAGTSTLEVSSNHPTTSSLRAVVLTITTDDNEHAIVTPYISVVRRKAKTHVTQVSAKIFEKLEYDIWS